MQTYSFSMLAGLFSHACNSQETYFQVRSQCLCGRRNSWDASTTSEGAVVSMTNGDIERQRA